MKRQRPTRITVELLKMMDACSYQVARFRRLWPTGAALTLKNLKLADERGLDLRWFADQFLTPTGFREYICARNAALRKLIGENYRLRCVYYRAVEKASQQYREGHITQAKWSRTMRSIRAVQQRGLHLTTKRWKAAHVHALWEAVKAQNKIVARQYRENVRRRR
jgi:hypothetical protein